MKLNFNVIVDKEKVYQGHIKRHMDLTNEINCSEKEQDELDNKAKKINAQWESKRIQITHDVGTVKKLRQNRSEVKLKRRERLEREYQRAHGHNVEVKHQINQNINVLRH